MLSSFSDDSNSIGEDSSYFLCPCGAEFDLLHRYERHLCEKNQRKTIIALDSDTQE
jgi:hypothetical protein